MEKGQSDELELPKGVNDAQSESEGEDTDWVGMNDDIHTIDKEMTGVSTDQIKSKMKRSIGSHLTGIFKNIVSKTKQKMRKAKVKSKFSPNNMLKTTFLDRAYSTKFAKDDNLVRLPSDDSSTDQRDTIYR